MSRWNIVAATAAVLLLNSHTAFARDHHRHHHRYANRHHHHHVYRHPRVAAGLDGCVWTNNGRKLCGQAPRATRAYAMATHGRRVAYASKGAVIGGRPAGCPHAYCGCGLRKYLGLTDKRLNLAWNWARLLPHASGPRTRPRRRPPRPRHVYRECRRKRPVDRARLQFRRRVIASPCARRAWLYLCQSARVMRSFRDAAERPRARTPGHDKSAHQFGSGFRVRALSLAPRNDTHYPRAIPLLVWAKLGSGTQVTCLALGAERLLAFGEAGKAATHPRIGLLMEAAPLCGLGGS